VNQLNSAATTVKKYTASCTIVLTASAETPEYTRWFLVLKLLS
jgi:hypothetical protein